MNKRNTRYRHLLEEKKQLEELLEAQKEQIRADLLLMKSQLEPVMDTAVLAGKLGTYNENSQLLGKAAGFLIDWLAMRLPGRKFAWLYKIMAPAVLKNYTSHYIAGHSDEWKQKMGRWIKKGNGKPYRPADN